MTAAGLRAKTPERQAICPSVKCNAYSRWTNTPRSSMGGVAQMGTSFLAVVLPTIVASLATSSTATIGEKVVAYCEEHLGQTVGNGECAGLATQALRAAGAQARARRDFPAKGDYVWGRQVCLFEGTPDGLKEQGTLSDVQAGDILQYRDVRFGKKGHASHHTAVVASVDVNRKVIKIFQQNSGGQRFVTMGQPHLKTLAAGWIRVYRPVAGTD
jgi:hypothetical protein